MIVAGASDWLDGYIARRSGIDSVLGSYLDPLADKARPRLVLIGCVTVAMVYTKLLPVWLVALVILRDAGLLLGAFIRRAQLLKWQWQGPSDFFRIDPLGADKMQPLFVSKLNTVLQLGLVISTLLVHAAAERDMFYVLPILRFAVAGTTIVSGTQYAAQFWRRK
eukprot:SM000092S24467  [mRNA]  locus=s92:36419:37741:+ [translate_table: standard]